MKTIDDVIEQCEEIANASKQHTLHMTHFSQSYDEWAEEWTQLAEWLKELKAYREQGGDAISRQAAISAIEALQRPIMRLESNYYQFKFSGMSEAREAVENLPSVTPQQRTGRCKDCKYFEYDSVAKVDGIPLIVAHEICKRWGDGCKSKEDGYCFLFEPKMQEVQDE